MTINSDLFTTITAFYALSLSSFDMNLHSHDSHEIMYVTKGSCIVEAKGQEYLLSEHQFIYLGRQVAHRLYIPDVKPCSLLNLEFCCQNAPAEINLAEPLKESPEFFHFWNAKIPCLAGDDTAHLGYALKDLISRLESSLPAIKAPDGFVQYQFPDQDYLVRLLFFRTRLELAQCSTASRQNAGMSYLKRACDYISSHLTEDIRVAQLAAYAGINKSYLQLLFSRYKNCSITGYINRKRLEKAVFLLINSSMSITDIAFHTGFNSRQHFGATFEKYYGTSPRTYRQLHGADSNLLITISAILSEEYS